MKRFQHGIHGHGDRPHWCQNFLQHLLISFWKDAEFGTVASPSLDRIAAFPILQRETRLLWKDRSTVSLSVFVHPLSYSSLCACRGWPCVRRDKSSPSQRLRCEWRSCRLSWCSLLCNPGFRPECCNPPSSADSGKQVYQCASSAGPRELPKSWRPSMTHTNP